MKARAILGVVACLWLAVCLPSSAEEVAKQVDAVFADLNRSDSPGCAAGVIRDGQLIYARGYGMASLELGVPITPHTVFYVGSTSKQFVAASIVLASLQGKLSLDDEIRKYLPEIPDYGSPITIRHLLHHTSGLRDYLTLMAMAGMPHENVYTNEEILALIARQKGLNFVPGAEYLYSNSGYFLLAEIIERATGQSLHRFAEENLFRPLGMRSTHFHDDRGHVVADRAMAYAPGDDDGFRLEWYSNFDKVGSGGLLTTVEDLLLWDRNFYDDQIGEGRLVTQMLQRGVLNDGTELDYAFGLMHGELRGLKTVSHAGSFMGFRAELLRLPAEKFSVAVLCNLSTANPSRRARQVAAVYLGEKMQPAGESLVAAPVAASASGGGPPPALSPEQLREYAGGYFSDELQTTYSIRVEAESLQLRVGNRPEQALTPAGTDRYRVPQMELHFLRDAEGKINALAAHTDRVREIRLEKK